MPSYELTMEKLGQTESAVRQAVTRLRRKFREHLRRRVAETLGHPSADEIDRELSALRAALMMLIPLRTSHQTDRIHVTGQEHIFRRRHL